MSCPTVLREKILKQLKSILHEQLADEAARVYLFGSWAREEEKQSSDIDIAIETQYVIPRYKWHLLIEKIEESTIPYRVDVLDLDNANDALVCQVKEEGILWIEYGNDWKQQKKPSQPLQN